MADPLRERDPMMLPGFDPMAEPPAVPWEPDPFAVEAYGPEGTPVAGWQDPRGEAQPLTYKAPWTYEQAIAGVTPAELVGRAAGVRNREAVLGAKKAAGLGGTELREAPGFGGAPARIPTFAELMKDIDVYQGTGSVSRTAPTFSKAEAEGYRGRLASATETEKEAAAQQSAIRQGMLQDVGVLQRKSRTRQALEYAAMLRQKADVDLKVAQQMEANHKLLDEIKNTHIDPERIYKGEGGTLRRVLHTLGVALGSFGASLNKTPNFALQIVERQLEADMKAQLAELNKKKFTYQAGRSAIQDLYQKTGDLRQTYLLAKDHYLDLAKTSIAALSSDAQSKEVQQASIVQQAALDRAQIQNEMKLKELAHERVTRTFGPRQMTPAALAASKALIGARLGAAMGGAGGAGATGDIKKIGTSTQINKVDGALETLIGLRNLEKTLHETDPIMPPIPAGEGVRKAFTGKSTRRFHAEQNPVKFTYIKGLTGAQYSEKELQRHEDQFVKGFDPTGIWGERSREEQTNKLNGMRQQMISVLRANVPLLRIKLQQNPKLLKLIGQDLRQVLK